MGNSFHSNLALDTVANPNYRKVLYTGKMQLVLMSLNPAEEIGLETHDTHDQFFRIEQGQAKAILDGLEVDLKEDEALIVAAGTLHNIINTGSTILKLYTIYAPAQHPAGTVQAVKPEND